MKKLYLLLFSALALFAFSPDSDAQTNTSFQEGDLVLNAGIGLGYTFSWAAGGLGLPLGAGVEYGVKDAIGVGGDLGFVSGGGLTMFMIGAKAHTTSTKFLILKIISGTSMVGWDSTTGALVFPALLVLWEVGYIQLFMQEPDITSLIISASMQNWGIQSVGFVPV